MSEFTSLPQVATCYLECSACPESYFGELVDGRTYYFRYRSATATLGVGADLQAACLDSWRRPAITCGEHMQGCFETADERDEVFLTLLAGVEDSRGDDNGVRKKP